MFLRDVLQRIVAEDQRVARRDNDGSPHELLALRSALIELCSRDGKLPPASKVGKNMRHFLKRNVGGRRFESELDSHSGTHRWRLVRLDGETIEAAVRAPEPSESDSDDSAAWNERIYEI